MEDQNNGKAQLRAPGLQKSEPLKLLPVLPLKFLPPPLGIGRCVRQVTGVPLYQLSSPTHLRKLTLGKGDLLSKALYILMTRG
jgi:hypothetical protein